MVLFRAHLLGLALAVLGGQVATLAAAALACCQTACDHHDGAAHHPSDSEGAACALPHAPADHRPGTSDHAAAGGQQPEAARPRPSSAGCGCDHDAAIGALLGPTAIESGRVIVEPLAASSSRPGPPLDRLAERPSAPVKPPPQV